MSHQFTTGVEHPGLVSSTANEAGQANHATTDVAVGPLVELTRSTGVVPGIELAEHGAATRLSRPHVEREAQQGIMLASGERNTDTLVHGPVVALEVLCEDRLALGVRIGCSALGEAPGVPVTNCRDTHRVDIGLIDPTLMLLELGQAKAPDDGYCRHGGDDLFLH